MTAQLLAQGIEARGSAGLSRVELHSMSRHLFLQARSDRHDVPPRL